MPRFLIPLAIAAFWAVDVGAQAAPAPTPPTPRPPTASAARRPAPRRPPLVGTVPIGRDALQRDLASILSRSTRSGRWGIMVISLATGDTLFARDADDQLLPASTMKLYTAAIAFERFGPAHQFRTEVLRTGAMLPDGTVEGDLFLRGAGDPSLAQKYAVWNEGLKPLDAIAGLVHDAGVRLVRGDIVGDASAFDDRRVPDGWRRRYLQANYAARVSALSVNENIAYIDVRATPRGAAVRFSQPLTDIPIHSTVQVRPGSRSAYIRVWQDTTADRFRVHGWIGALSPTRTYQVVVEQPEHFAAAAFRAALAARGIIVEGAVRADQAPVSAQRVAVWGSPPLAQLIATMNGESNNHFAELLFRNTARSVGGVGSAGVANESLRAFMADRVGVARDAVYAADGSGLSTLDRVTPRSMAMLLAYAAAAPWGMVYRSTLPVAGRSETLRTRMRRTAAENNLRAKTGTTNEAASLGGYVTSRSGEELAFAFIYNGRDLSRAREAIDAMGVTLAGFAR